MIDLKGKTIVFTGFRDNDLKQSIEDKGGRVVSAISGKTDILITSGSKGVNSQKVKNADKVLVINKEDFIKNHVKKSFISKLFGSSHQSDQVGKEQCYLIHDNGARPFKVCMNKSKFWIYVFNSSDDPEMYSKIILKPTAYIKSYIGTHGKDKIYTGNSMLFQILPNTYMHIGREIFTFVIKDKIIDYYSPVGNSDVPYPYAKGTKNTYIMLEKTYIINELLIEKDPYVQLYGQNTGFGIRKAKKLEDEHKEKYKLKTKTIKKRLSQYNDHEFVKRK